MSAEYLSHSEARAIGSIVVDKPTGTLPGMLLIAVGFNYHFGQTPTVTPPAGWTERGVRTTINHCYYVWTRLAEAGEPATYTFTTASNNEGNAEADATILIGAYRKVRTADPLHVVGVASTETSSANNLTAPGITTTIDDCLLVFAGGASAAKSSGPEGWTDHWGGTGFDNAVLAETAQGSAGPTGDITFVLANGTTHRRAMLLALAAGLPPTTPAITAPANLSGKAPGATIPLTASATQPDSTQIKYRWYYNTGGADTLIGESALADSGVSATYNWDTSGLPAGIYQLKCWAVSAEGAESSTYATVTIYLADAVLTAPAAGSSHVAGTMTITGRGYLVGSGSVRLQVEIDTHDPPDDESEDYDLITSALVDQGESVSVIGNITHLGTWYLRARAWDETAETASDWTDVRLVYVLEGLRLLSGSKVELSTLAVYNRVYAVVKGSDPPIVGVATNTTVSPTYAESPREMWVEVPEGSDQTTADAIAAAKLALLQEERITLSGLKVSLADGLKLQRGQRVGVQIDRLGLNLTLPVRELSFDLAAATCDVVLGDFWEPRTDQDAYLALAQKVQQIQKEAAA